MTNNTTSVQVIHSAYEDQPVLVATINCQSPKTIFHALEQAFYLTQNIDESWSMTDLSFRQKLYPFDSELQNAELIVEAPLHVQASGKVLGLRSTSVGDQMMIDGKSYTVAGVGFVEAHDGRRRLGSLTTRRRYSSSHK